MIWEVVWVKYCNNIMWFVMNKCFSIWYRVFCCICVFMVCFNRDSNFICYCIYFSMCFLKWFFCFMGDNSCKFFVVFFKFGCKVFKNNNMIFKVYISLVKLCIVGCFNCISYLFSGGGFILLNNFVIIWVD